MRKHLPHQLAELGQFSVLLCLTVCFSCGIAAGCFFAGLLSDAAQSGLSAYLNGCFAVYQDGGTALPSLLSTAWELCRWPLLILLLNFTALGVLGIPLSFLVRGFLLSYAVSVFVRLFGVAGFLAALVLFGISGVFAIPSLFILGVDALCNAGALAGGSRQALSLREGQFVRICGCCGLLIVGTFVQLWLSPALLRVVSRLLI